MNLLDFQLQTVRNTEIASTIKQIAKEEKTPKIVILTKSVQLRLMTTSCNMEIKLQKK